MNKYIVELEPAVKNHLECVNSDLLCEDLIQLINALDNADEFYEDDYLENFTDSQLEDELEKRRVEKEQIKRNRIDALELQKADINEQLRKLKADEEEN